MVGGFTTHFMFPILAVGLNRMFTATNWMLPHGQVNLIFSPTSPSSPTSQPPVGRKPLPRVVHSRAAEIFGLPGEAKAMGLARMFRSGLEAWLTLEREQQLKFKWGFPTEPQ